MNAFARQGGKGKLAKMGALWESQSLCKREGALCKLHFLPLGVSPGTQITSSCLTILGSGCSQLLTSPLLGLDPVLSLAFQSKPWLSHLPRVSVALQTSQEMLGGLTRRGGCTQEIFRLILEVLRVCHIIFLLCVCMYV